MRLEDFKGILESQGTLTSKVVGNKVIPGEYSALLYFSLHCEAWF